MNKIKWYSQWTPSRYSKPTFSEVYCGTPHKVTLNPLNFTSVRILTISFKCMGTLLNPEQVVGEFNWDFRDSYAQKIGKKTTLVVSYIPCNCNFDSSWAKATPWIQLLHYSFCGICLYSLLPTEGGSERCRRENARWVAGNHVGQVFV